MSARAAIRFENLTLGYGRHPAVHHLDGEIAAGSLTAIVGPNGAGKSTLLKGIVGTLRPLDGGVALTDGKTARIAYLPQAAEIDKTFPLAVYDLVAMGLWSRTGLFGGVGRKDRARIEEALAAVGLTAFERRPIATLSGGQMQRALFARLLLHDAHTLLLDEPFAAVDRHTTEDLMVLLQDWHREGRTVIAVLHDLDMVRAYFPQALLLAGQAVAWGPTDQVLTAENLHLARHLCAGDYL